jgi:two-component system, OmpR family, response regulator
MKILVVKDDEGAVDFIAAGLAARGHEATVACDGRAGYLRAVADRFDVIVLDRMLPELDGLSVVALMRGEGVSTPVL